MTTKKNGSGRGLRKTLRLVSIGLMGAIVIREMRKPAEDREWHGKLGDLVPYDLRMPTADRVRARMWDPDGPLINPRAFGVGWTLNVGAVVRKVQDRLGTEAV